MATKHQPPPDSAPSIPPPNKLYASVMTSFAPHERASRAEPFGAGVVLSQTVHGALINPTRGHEMRGWAAAHPEIARQWRGSDGETMMHWAFLSSWEFAGDLEDLGLSFTDRDALGRTPMDWLNDRLWASLVAPATSGRLSAGGQERLRRHTEQQILRLWPLGARPAPLPFLDAQGAFQEPPDPLAEAVAARDGAAPATDQRLHPGVVWVRSGAWDLVDLLNIYPLAGGRADVVPVSLVRPPPAATVSPNGPPSESVPGSVRSAAGWFHWTATDGSGLHAWVLAPDSHLKQRFLDAWLERGLDVDARDQDGRTPLWYAVDAWLAAPDGGWRRSLESAIAALRRAGADPTADDADGVAPWGEATRTVPPGTWDGDRLRALLDPDKVVG